MGELIGPSGLVMCGASIICILFSTAYPFWLTHYSGTTAFKGGLWTYCNESNGMTEDCSSVLPALTSHTDRTKLRAVRATMILSLIFSVAALVVHVHFLYLIWDQILGYIAGGLESMAALFLDIGIVIFISRVATENIGYHAGFFFAVLGMVMSKVTAVLFIKRARKGSGGIAFKKWT